MLFVLRLEDSDYSFGIFWPLCCLSFDLRILITHLVSYGLCVVCPSTYGFWLLLWYLQTLLASVYGTQWPMHTDNLQEINQCKLETNGRDSHWLKSRNFKRNFNNILKYSCNYLYSQVLTRSDNYVDQGKIVLALMSPPLFRGHVQTQWYLPRTTTCIQGTVKTCLMCNHLYSEDNLIWQLQISWEPVVGTICTSGVTFGGNIPCILVWFSVYLDNGEGGVDPIVMNCIWASFGGRCI